MHVITINVNTRMCLCFFSLPPSEHFLWSRPVGPGVPPWERQLSFLMCATVKTQYIYVVRKIVSFCFLWITAYKYSFLYKTKLCSKTILMQNREKKYRANFHSLTRNIFEGFRCTVIYQKCFLTFETMHLCIVQSYWLSTNTQKLVNSLLTVYRTER